MIRKLPLVDGVSTLNGSKPMKSDFHQKSLPIALEYKADQSLGKTFGINSGYSLRTWKRRARRNPSWDFCSSVPLFQKKNVAIQSGVFGRPDPQELV
jgi:hypothetical protein